MSTEASDKEEARKGGGISLKLFATVAIILVLAVSALGYYAYTLKNANNSLNEQLADLNKNYTSLNAQYESLKANYTSLEASCTSLKNQYDSLMANYTSLNAQYNSLLSNYISLEASYSSLKNQYDSLLANYTSLNTQYDSLLSNYNSLEVEYNNLAIKYNDTLAIVNLALSRTLERNTPVQVPAYSSTYLTYRLSYAGYLVITFSATGGVYFYVGNGDYWVRYPSPSSSSSVASSGSFIVPVLPGTTYVYIYNPALFTGASVTISITYVY